MPMAAITARTRGRGVGPGGCRAGQAGRNERLPAPGHHALSVQLAQSAGNRIAASVIQRAATGCWSGGRPAG